MKLLVVEDAVPVRNRLISSLSDLKGVEVVGYAAAAPEAIENFRASRPDVVTLDIRLPGGSGIEVLRTIKGEAPDTVVIMFTDHGLPQYRVRCAQEGANHFFEKSGDFTKLLQAVALLSRRFVRARRRRRKRP